MVRHLTTKTRAWTAFLAILVAGGAVVWHVLACTESPMAFSPDGKQLAFVTMEPYDAKGIGLVGQNMFHLMVLPSDGHPRVLETTTDEMLSAPAFSPDGKNLAYVRIRLMTEKVAERYKKIAEWRKSALPFPATDLWTEPLTSPTGSAATQPATSQPGQTPSPPSTSQPSKDVADLALPSYEGLRERVLNQMIYPPVPGDLVIREVETGRIVSTTPVDLPNLAEDDGQYLIAYTTLHPQYSADGKWIYFCAGAVVQSVNPTTREKRVFSLGAPIAVLSPDCETIAVLTENALGFIQTDGSSALYKRLDKQVSLSGLVWADRRSLAVLEYTEKKDDAVRVHFLERDGSIKRSITLPIGKHDSDKDVDTGELAIAPNGKYVVVAFQHDVFFCDSDGKLIGHWTGANDTMAQPTFSPDSSRIACKYMTKDPERGYSRVAAIVFFSPEGKQLSSVPIPPIDPATTQRSTEN